MAKTWGSLSWGVGNFGSQSDNTVALTGVSLQTNVGNTGISTTVEFGWGRLDFGENAWGIAGDVEVTGIGLNAGIGVGSVFIDVENAVTGQQLNWSIGSLSFDIGATVDLTGQQLNTVLGSASEQGESNLSVTGQQLNFSLNSVTVDTEINSGWGGDAWGENAWGIFGDVLVTGLSLTANLGTVIGRAGAGADISGQQLNLSLNSVSLDIGATVSVTGQQLNTDLGNPFVEGTSFVGLTGLGLQADLGNTDAYNEVGWGRDEWGIEVWGSSGIWVEVPVTGQQQNLTLASVTAQANADADVTGQQLNTSVGDTTETGNGAVDLTGLGLEFSIGDTTETADAIVSINNDVLTSFTAEADAQLSTAQAKFGPSSLLLDGTGDFVQSNASGVVQNNFTIEFFAYASNFAQDAYLWDNQSSNQGFAVSLTQFGQLRLIQDNTILQQTGASGLNNNQWNHIALVQNGLFLDLYINGTSRLQYNTGGDSYPGQSYKIGTNEGETQFFNGYIDEFRSSDIARYTTTFTPTTSAFTADSNTFALLHFDGANGSTTITNSVGSDIPRIALGVNDGTAVGEPNTIASPTGIQQNISQGVTGAGASANVFVTGQSVVITLGNEVGQVWNQVDTGTTVAYTEVSTGTSVAFTEVSTGTSVAYTEVSTGTSTNFTEVSTGVTVTWEDVDTAA